MTTETATKQMIPVFRPSYGQEEIDAVAEVLRSGWVGLGPKVEEFEKAFAEYIGVNHAIAVNSCTAALHLALLAAGVGPGDEVIVPAITFVSTAHAVKYTEADVVFADVEADTLCIDIEDVERKIVKGKLSCNTKAIIPMHYGGQPCDMESLARLCLENGVSLIEDAAHACGSSYRDYKVGSIGALGCFSFHAVKNLATGDGGMITTNSHAYAEKLRRLRWLGIDKNTWSRTSAGADDKPGYGWQYDVTELGYKYHMNDITAAIGLVQLRKLDASNQQRLMIANIYTRSFSGIDYMGPVLHRGDHGSSHHNYACLLDEGIDRAAFIAHMNEHGVSIGVHYMPVNELSYYADAPQDTPVAHAIWKRIVLLPMFPDMTGDEQDRVIEAIYAFQA